MKADELYTILRKAYLANSLYGTDRTYLGTMRWSGRGTRAVQPRSYAA
jgi:hypothetical protein